MKTAFIFLAILLTLPGRAQDIQRDVVRLWGTVNRIPVTYPAPASCNIERVEFVFYKNKLKVITFSDTLLLIKISSVQSDYCKTAQVYDELHYDQRYVVYVIDDAMGMAMIITPVKPYTMTRLYSIRLSSKPCN